MALSQQPDGQSTEEGDQQSHAPEPSDAFQHDEPAEHEKRRQIVPEMSPVLMLPRREQDAEKAPSGARLDAPLISWFQKENEPHGQADEKKSHQLLGEGLDLSTKDHPSILPVVSQQTTLKKGQSTRQE